MNFYQYLTIKLKKHKLETKNLRKSIIATAFSILISTTMAHSNLNYKRLNSQKKNGTHLGNSSHGKLQLDKKIKHIVVFGDSYSDNGNTFKLSSSRYPSSKRYWHGRFSNGRVWTEYLAKDLNLDPENRNQLANYAYGEAQAKGNLQITHKSNQKNISFIVPDIQHQYIQYMKHPLPEPLQTLYVIFIGANDTLNKLPSNTNKQNTLAERIISSQQKLINELRKNNNAHYFLLVNLRDLNLAPIALTLAKKIVGNT